MHHKKNKHSYNHIKHRKCLQLLEYYHIPKVVFNSTVLESFAHIMHLISKKVETTLNMIKQILALIQQCCSEIDLSFPNISEMLQIICENCEILDRQIIQILFTYSQLILLNPHNCTHLVAIFVKGEQCGLCSKDQMITLLLREADPNMTKSLFISCITLMIPAKEVMDIFLGENVDRTLLARAITIIPARSIVISNAITLVFPFLISIDDKIRQIMEQYIASIIPSKNMPKKAENIISGEDEKVHGSRDPDPRIRNLYRGLYGFDGSSDDSLSSIDDSDSYDEDVNLDINLELFSSLLIQFSSSISIQRIYQKRNNSLTAFARTIQRLAKHVPSSDLCKAALRLLFDVCEYDIECDANKLEFARAVAAFDFDIISESLGEDVDSVLEFLFPVSFNDYEYGCQLFVSSFNYIPKSFITLCNSFLRECSQYSPAILITFISNFCSSDDCRSNL